MRFRSESVEARGKMPARAFAEELPKGGHAVLRRERGGGGKMPARAFAEEALGMPERDRR